jgi:hypothetical protein
MSNEAGFLDTRCREHDPRERPDFPDICRELRYIKTLLLTGKLLFLSPQATLPSATHDI